MAVAQDPLTGLSWRNLVMTALQATMIMMMTMHFKGPGKGEGLGDPPSSSKEIGSFIPNFMPVNTFVAFVALTFSYGDTGHCNQFIP